MQTSINERGFELCLGAMEKRLLNLDFSIKCLAHSDPGAVREVHEQMIATSHRIRSPDLKRRFDNVVSIYDAVATALGY